MLLFDDVLVEIRYFLLDFGDKGTNLALKISFISCANGWSALINPVPLH